MTPGTLEFVNEDDTTLLRLELQNEKGLYYCGINGSAEEHKEGVAEGKALQDWINNMGPWHVSNTIVKVVTRSESQLVSQETYSDEDDNSDKSGQDETKIWIKDESCVKDTQETPSPRVPHPAKSKRYTKRRPITRPEQLESELWAARLGFCGPW